VARILLGALSLARAEDELTGTLKKANDTGTVTVGYRESSLPPPAAITRSPFRW
jgi:hypothetical protein